VSDQAMRALAAAEEGGSQRTYLNVIRKAPPADSRSVIRQPMT
jgi:hypothetical protein